MAERERVSRRRLIFSGAVGAIATLFHGAAPAGASKASRATPPGGVAEIVGGTRDRLRVRTQVDGAGLTVSTTGFAQGWTFEPGELVCVTTNGDPAGSLVAEPYLLVSDEPGRRIVYVFNTAGRARRAAVVLRP
jgi:hypothetical protein